MAYQNAKRLRGVSEFRRQASGRSVATLDDGSCARASEILNMVFALEDAQIHGEGIRLLAGRTRRNAYDVAVLYMVARLLSLKGIDHQTSAGVDLELMLIRELKSRCNMHRDKFEKLIDSVVNHRTALKNRWYVDYDDWLKDLQMALRSHNLPATIDCSRSIERNIEDSILRQAYADHTSPDKLAFRFVATARMH